MYLSASGSPVAAAGDLVATDGVEIYVNNNFI